MVIEYAESLKAQLGDLYEAEYDKLTVKQRIETMKIIKKTMDKYPVRTEGKAPIAPQPDLGKNKIKSHIELYDEGANLWKSPNSSLGVTLFKND